MGLREDQIMLNFTSRLKNIATRYNIYLSTATQLNRNSNDRGLRDATAIRGGQSTIDKADHAIQMYKVTKEDLKDIEQFLKRGFKQPNFMHVVYKNRSGLNNVIIYTLMNHGNMREEICFVTTMNHEPVNINPMYFEFDEEQQIA